MTIAVAIARAIDVTRDEAKAAVALAVAHGLRPDLERLALESGLSIQTLRRELRDATEKLWRLERRQKGPFNGNRSEEPRLRV